MRALPGLVFSRRRPRCSQCGALLPAQSAEVTPCGRCLTQRPAFDTTVVAADYLAPVDQLVLGLKFGNQLAFAPALASILYDTVRNVPQLTLPHG